VSRATVYEQRLRLLYLRLRPATKKKIRAARWMQSIDARAMQSRGVAQALKTGDLKRCMPAYAIQRRLKYEAPGSHGKKVVEAVFEEKRCAKAPVEIST